RHQTPVPDVLNLLVGDAQARLEQAGFVVEVISACPDGAPRCSGARARPGRVWQQSPDAGASVPAHSVVQLSAYPSD
ncbi:MAG: PASTA domain-containing protein, partial [Actinomycetota bacterium]|nr:PASTA domain-containing protein [Actinomycetota bacterium]